MWTVWDQPAVCLDAPAPRDPCQNEKDSGMVSCRRASIQRRPRTGEKYRRWGRARSGEQTSDTAAVSQPLQSSPGGCKSRSWWACMSIIWNILTELHWMKFYLACKNVWNTGILDQRITWTGEIGETGLEFTVGWWWYICIVCSAYMMQGQQFLHGCECGGLLINFAIISTATQFANGSRQYIKPCLFSSSPGQVVTPIGHWVKNLVHFFKKPRRLRLCFASASLRCFCMRTNSLQVATATWWEQHLTTVWVLATVLTRKMILATDRLISEHTCPHPWPWLGRLACTAQNPLVPPRSSSMLHLPLLAWTTPLGDLWPPCCT